MKKRTRNILMLLVIVAAALLLIQFIPKLSLNASNMQTYEGESLSIHYAPVDEAEIKKMATYMEGEIKRINAFYNFSGDGNLYIYPDQNTFHRKKYGTFIELVKLFTDLDWYIGDNIGETVIAVSPNTELTYHDKNSVYGMLPHEYVHTVNYRLNPEMPLWINEGMALYLANGKPLKSIQGMRIPTYEEIQTSNPITFADFNGYQLAHIYIEKMIERFGKEKAMSVILGEKTFEIAFGISDKAFYDYWVEELRKL